MYVPINVQQGIPHSSYSHLNSNKHHHSSLMLAQHVELQCLCGFIFYGCRTNSCNFLLWINAQGPERMSLDESTDTWKKPLLGDAEARRTTGETAELEKSQQRRGRIFYVSSQNVFFTVFFKWIRSSLDLINFFPPETLEPFVPRQILHRCFHGAYFFPAFSW